jgi:predicted RNase H-like HicB family nuclease
MSDFTVDLEREIDDRWIGEVVELPGVMVYGDSQDEAVAKAKALAFRVLADRLEHGLADLRRRRNVAVRAIHALRITRG